MKPWLSATLSRWQVELGAFATWWLQELRELCEALLARLAPRLVTRTLVRLETQSGSIWTIRGAQRQCVGTFCRDSAGEWPQQLRSPEVSDALRQNKAVFALAPGYVLTHTLTLPASVERELEDVIGLQLERECPMPLDRVWVDRGAGKRSRTDRTIAVDVLIIQRDCVERLRELAAMWELRLVRIGMSVGETGVVGNFLRTPETRSRLQLTRMDRRLLVVASILAVVCVGLIGFDWGYERIEVGRELRRLQGPAAAADRLARQLQTDAVPAEALVGLMRQPDALEVLGDLNRDVPKDSWIYDLDISAQWPRVARIKFSGFTPVATTLLGELQNTGGFAEVRLVSAISAGLGSGQDRVQLDARQASHTDGTRGALQ